MPLQVLAEKMRQTLGVDGRHFQPISLERYKQALGDAARFADWLEQYQRTAGDLEQSMQRFFTSTSSAIQDCPLPSLYSERYDTHELRPLPPPPLPQQYSHLAQSPTLNPTTAARAGPALNPNEGVNPLNHPGLGFNAQTATEGLNPTPTPEGSNSEGSSSWVQDRVEGGSGALGLGGVGSGGSGGEGLETLSNRFADKMQWQLMVPMDLWVHAFREAKARLTALDTLRLKVDAQRRKVERRSRHFIDVHHKHHGGKHINIPGGSSSSSTVPGRSPRAAAATSSDSFVAGTLETGRPSGSGRDQAATAAAAAELAGDLDRRDRDLDRRDRDRDDVSDGEESPGSDDEETWAEAVYRRRGEQGLLAAHEMVERKLQPLLSEFSRAEMALSTLLGWLITQAARLRAYVTHMLLASAGHVDSWQLPPGLLEPFPADIVPLDATAAAALHTTPAAAAPSGPIEYLKQRSLKATTPPAAAAAAAAAVHGSPHRPSLGSDFRSSSGKEPTTADAAAGVDLDGADSSILRNSQGSPAADAAAANTAATAAAAREAVLASGSSGSGSSGAEVGGSGGLDVQSGSQRSRLDQPVTIEDQILDNERSKIQGLLDSMRNGDMGDSAVSDAYMTPDSDAHYGRAAPAAGWRSPAATAAAGPSDTGAIGPDAGIVPVENPVRDRSSNGLGGSSSSRGIMPDQDYATPGQELGPTAAAAHPAITTNSGARSTDRPADVAAAAASDLPRSIAAAPVAGAVAAALASLDRDRHRPAAAEDNLGLGAPRDLVLEPVRSSDVAAAVPAADLPGSLAAAPAAGFTGLEQPAAALIERPDLASVAAAAAADLPKSVAPRPAAGAVAAALMAQDRDRSAPPAAEDNLGLGPPRDIDLEPVTSADVAAAVPASDLPGSLVAAPAAGTIASRGRYGDYTAAPGGFVPPAAAAGGYDTEPRPTLDLRNSSREWPYAPTPPAAEPEVVPASHPNIDTADLVAPVPAPAAADREPQPLWDTRSPSPLSPAVAAIRAETQRAAGPGRTGSGTSSTAGNPAATPSAAAAAAERPYELPPSNLPSNTPLAGSFSPPAAAAAAPMTLPYLETDRALLNALGTETGCEVCGSDSPHAAVEKERQGLLARVAELEREHADHAAAAAEADRLRAAAEARAREIDMRLKMEVPSEKQRLLQQQEAASAELAELRSRHAAVGDRVNRLKADLGSLVQQQQDILNESMSVNDERYALESSRDRLAARISELRALADELRGREAESDRGLIGRREELERLQTQVSEAESALADAEGGRQRARTRLNDAQRELDQVEVEVSSLESQLLPLQHQLNQIDKQDLPEVTTALADIDVEQQRLQQQEIPSLESTVRELRADEQQKGALAQDLRHRAVQASHGIVDIDHECEHLACQEASLKAQAARAQAAHQAETARLQAAEAEAKGLKDAAGSINFYHKMAAAAKAAAAKVTGAAGRHTAASAEGPAANTDTAAGASPADVATAEAPAVAMEAAALQPRSADLAPQAELAQAADTAPADLDVAPSADQPPAPSHDAELAHAAELAHEAAVTNDAELARQADLAREAEAYNIAQEKGISLDTARKIVGLPAHGSPAEAAPAAATADQEAVPAADAGTAGAAAAPAADQQALPRATTTPATSGRASTEDITPARPTGDQTLPRSDTEPSTRKQKTRPSIFKPIDSMKQLLKRQQLRKKWKLGTKPLGGAPDEPPEVEEIVATHQGGGLAGGLTAPGVRDQDLGRAEAEAGFSAEGQEGISSTTAAAAGPAEGAAAGGEAAETAGAPAAAPAAAVPMGPLAAEGSSSRQPLETASIGSSRANGRAAGAGDQYATPAAGSAGVSPTEGMASPRADVGSQSQRRDQYVLQNTQKPSVIDTRPTYSKRQSDKYGQYAPEYEQQYLPGYAPAAAAPGSSSSLGGKRVEGEGVYQARGPLEAAGDVGYDQLGHSHGSSRRHQSSSGRY